MENDRTCRTKQKTRIYCQNPHPKLLSTFEFEEQIIDYVPCIQLDEQVPDIAIETYQLPFRQ